MKRYKITIDLETDNQDYCCWCGKQNLIYDLCERLGCSENDIEIEEIEEIEEIKEKYE